MNFWNRLLQRVVLKYQARLRQLGVDVCAVGYTSPAPELRDLTEEFFARTSPCSAIEWNLEAQLSYLDSVFPNYAGEDQFSSNPGLSPVDAAILHCMIRHHKPGKIIEVGSGYSTQFCARACLRNAAEGAAVELLAVEPHPSETLRRGFPGLTRLERRRAQDLPVSFYADCNLLFIDSSHIVKAGSDVTFLVLEVLPMLRPGTLVHFHDILLPNEYWPGWLRDGRSYWNEQYLVHAFLAFNATYDVQWASRYMHVHYADAIKTVFPFFDVAKHRISSLWIQRCAGDTDG